MNVLADNHELLKYMKIWNKIEALFNKKNNKKEFYSKPIYNNEYIKTKVSPYNENFYGNKKLTKHKYYGHSILLLEFICEVENKHDPQTFLDKFFEIHNYNYNNIGKLFNELVQIIDWSDDEESNN